MAADDGLRLEDRVAVPGLLEEAGHLVGGPRLEGDDGSRRGDPVEDLPERAVSRRGLDGGDQAGPGGQPVAEDGQLLRGQQVGVVDEDDVGQVGSGRDGVALGGQAEGATAALEVPEGARLAEAGRCDEQHVTTTVGQHPQRGHRGFGHDLRVTRGDVSGHQSPYGAMLPSAPSATPPPESSAADVGVGDRLHVGRDRVGGGLRDRIAARVRRRRVARGRIRGGRVQAGGSEAGGSLAGGSDAGGSLAGGSDAGGFDAGGLAGGVVDAGVEPLPAGVDPPAGVELPAGAGPAAGRRRGAARRRRHRARRGVGSGRADHREELVRTQGSGGIGQPLAHRRPGGATRSGGEGEPRSAEDPTRRAGDGGAPRAGRGGRRRVVGVLHRSADGGHGGDGDEHRGRQRQVGRPRNRDPREASPGSHERGRERRRARSRCGGRRRGRARHRRRRGRPRTGRRRRDGRGRGERHHRSPAASRAGQNRGRRRVVVLRRTRRGRRATRGRRRRPRPRSSTPVRSATAAVAGLASTSPTRGTAITGTSNRAPAASTSEGVADAPPRSRISRSGDPSPSDRPSTVPSVSSCRVTRGALSSSTSPRTMRTGTPSTSTSTAVSADRATFARSHSRRRLGRSTCGQPVGRPKPVPRLSALRRVSSTAWPAPPRSTRTATTSPAEAPDRRQTAASTLEPPTCRTPTRSPGARSAHSGVAATAASALDIQVTSVPTGSRRERWPSTAARPRRESSTGCTSVSRVGVSTFTRRTRVATCRATSSAPDSASRPMMTGTGSSTRARTLETSTSPSRRRCPAPQNHRPASVTRRSAGNWPGSDPLTSSGRDVVPSWSTDTQRLVSPSSTTISVVTSAEDRSTDPGAATAPSDLADQRRGNRLRSGHAPC